MKTIKTYSRSETSIKKYLDFISENKKEIDEKSTPIEVDEKEIEKDEDSEKEE